MIKAKERNVTIGIKISKSLLEKKMTVGEPKKMWPFESCQVLKKVTIRKK